MICSPVSWEVPISPRNRPSRTWESPKRTLLERLSRTSNGAATDDIKRALQAAETRRTANLEEKRRKSRDVYLRAKSVAALHALEEHNRTMQLRSEIHARQERALRRRCIAQLSKRARETNRTCGSALVLNVDDSRKQTEERSLVACLRACQRLACVVARSRLHNARAKLLSMRARAARHLQSLWRQIRRIKFIARQGPDVGFALNGLPSDPDFETTVAFLQSSRALNGASVLVGTRNKVFLAGYLVMWNREEAVSMSDRSAASLSLAFRRLLRHSRLLLEACMAFSEPVSLPERRSTVEQLHLFDRMMSAYQALFDCSKQEDADCLAHESFETLVQLRLLVEESPPGSEERTMFERGFFQVVGRLKRLYQGVNAPDKYKGMLARCARTVKSRREVLHVGEELVLDKNFVSSTPREVPTASVPLDTMSRREWWDYVITMMHFLVDELNDLTPHRLDLHKILSDTLIKFRAGILAEEELTTFDCTSSSLSFGRTGLRPQLVAVLGVIFERTSALTEDEDLDGLENQRRQQAEALHSCETESSWRCAVQASFLHLAEAAVKVREQVDAFLIAQIQDALHSGDAERVRQLATRLKQSSASSVFVTWCEATSAAIHTVSTNNAPSSTLGQAPETPCPPVMVSGLHPSPHHSGKGSFIALEPFEQDAGFKRQYLMLAEVLPRVVMGEISSYPLDSLGLSLSRALKDASEGADAILCEAHNHMIWKQLLLVSNASLGPTLDKTRCGTSVEAVLGATEAVLGARGRRVSRELASNLTRLVLNQGCTTLRRVLSRRASELLSQVLVAPRFVDQLLSDRAVQALGLGLLKDDFRFLAEKVQRISVLLAVQ